MMTAFHLSPVRLYVQRPMQRLESFTDCDLGRNSCLLWLLEIPYQTKLIYCVSHGCQTISTIAV